MWKPEELAREASIKIMWENNSKKMGQKKEKEKKKQMDIKWACKKDNYWKDQPMFNPQ